MKRSNSISLGKSAPKHDRREYHAENTDPERTKHNRVFVDIPVSEAYGDLFGEALGRYNERQRAAKRKELQDYYRHVRGSKRMQASREIVVQIGNREDTPADSETGELAAEVLAGYAEGFSHRNPYFRVIGEYLHMDESTPHLHITFIPYATGAKRGLDTHVSLTGALRLMGFESGGRDDTAWQRWVEAEREQLGFEMEKHGIEWERAGNHERHLSVTGFKVKKLTEENVRLKAELQRMTEKVMLLQSRQAGLEQTEAQIRAISEGWSDPDGEYRLPEAPRFMSAGRYRRELAEPVFLHLKSTAEGASAQSCMEKQRAGEAELRCRTAERRAAVLEHENERLQAVRQTGYRYSDERKLLRRAFGSEGYDDLLDKAKKIEERKIERRREESFPGPGSGRTAFERSTGSRKTREEPER